MDGYESDWMFNLVLRLAVIICLGTLVLGLMVGVGPLTALLRSGIAFVAFVLLGWAASLVWVETEEACEPRDDATDNVQAASPTSQPAVDA